MDMFTDVDIFADLLEAASRLVPVYILLDEQDSCHFVSMVLNCKVNLERIPVSLHSCPPSNKTRSNLVCEKSILTSTFNPFKMSFADDARQDGAGNNLSFQNREIF